MSDWQPIETAPKDGEWFLAIRGKIPFVTAFDDHDDTLFTFNQHYETDQRRLGRDPTWSPTHWQPLPSPPEKQP